MNSVALLCSGHLFLACLFLRRCRFAISCSCRSALCMFFSSRLPVIPQFWLRFLSLPFAVSCDCRCAWVFLICSFQVAIPSSGVRCRAQWEVCRFVVQRSFLVGFAFLVRSSFRFSSRDYFYGVCHGLRSSVWRLPSGSLLFAILCNCRLVLRVSSFVCRSTIRTNRAMICVAGTCGSLPS